MYNLFISSKSVSCLSSDERCADFSRYKPKSTYSWQLYMSITVVFIFGYGICTTIEWIYIIRILQIVKRWKLIMKLLQINLWNSKFVKNLFTFISLIISFSFSSFFTIFYYLLCLLFHGEYLSYLSGPSCIIEVYDKKSQRKLVISVQYVSSLLSNLQ